MDGGLLVPITIRRTEVNTGDTEQTRFHGETNKRKGRNHRENDSR